MASLQSVSSLRLRNMFPVPGVNSAEWSAASSGMPSSSAQSLSQVVPSHGIEVLTRGASGGHLSLRPLDRYDIHKSDRDGRYMSLFMRNARATSLPGSRVKVVGEFVKGGRERRTDVHFIMQGRNYDPTSRNFEFISVFIDYMNWEEGTKSPRPPIAVVLSSSYLLIGHYRFEVSSSTRRGLTCELRCKLISSKAMSFEATLAADFKFLAKRVSTYHIVLDPPVTTHLKPISAGVAALSVMNELTREGVVEHRVPASIPWDGVTPITVVVHIGRNVVLGNGDTTSEGFFKSPGLDISGNMSIVGPIEVIIEGQVYGSGGEGGEGGSEYFAENSHRVVNTETADYNPGFPGGDGAHAIVVTHPRGAFVRTLGSTARILGGGGGGGGGPARLGADGIPYRGWGGSAGAGGGWGGLHGESPQTTEETRGRGSNALVRVEFREESDPYPFGVHLSPTFNESMNAGGRGGRWGEPGFGGGVSPARAAGGLPGMAIFKAEGAGTIYASLQDGIVLGGVAQHVPSQPLESAYDFSEVHPEVVSPSEVDPEVLMVNVDVHPVPSHNVEVVISPVVMFHSFQHGYSISRVQMPASSGHTARPGLVGKLISIDGEVFGHVISAERDRVLVSPIPISTIIARDDENGMGVQSVEFHMDRVVSSPPAASSVVDVSMSQRSHDMWQYFLESKNRFKYIPLYMNVNFGGVHNMCIVKRSEVSSISSILVCRPNPSSTILLDTIPAKVFLESGVSADLVALSQAVVQPDQDFTCAAHSKAIGCIEEDGALVIPNGLNDSFTWPTPEPEANYRLPHVVRVMDGSLKVLRVGRSFVFDGGDVDVERRSYSIISPGEIAQGQLAYFSRGGRSYEMYGFLLDIVFEGESEEYDTSSAPFAVYSEGNSFWIPKRILTISSPNTHAIMKARLFFGGSETYLDTTSSPHPHRVHVDGRVADRFDVLYINNPIFSNGTGGSFSLQNGWDMALLSPSVFCFGLARSASVIQETTGMVIIPSSTSVGEDVTFFVSGLYWDGWQSKPILEAQFQDNMKKIVIFREGGNDPEWFQVSKGSYFSHVPPLDLVYSISARRIERDNNWVIFLNPGYQMFRSANNYRLTLKLGFDWQTPSTEYVVISENVKDTDMCITVGAFEGNYNRPVIIEMFSYDNIRLCSMLVESAYSMTGNQGTTILHPSLFVDYTGSLMNNNIMKLIDPEYVGANQGYPIIYADGQKLLVHATSPNYQMIDTDVVGYGSDGAPQLYVLSEELTASTSYVITANDEVLKFLFPHWMFHTVPAASSRVENMRFVKHQGDVYQVTSIRDLPGSIFTVFETTRVKFQATFFASTLRGKVINPNDPSSMFPHKRVRALYFGSSGSERKIPGFVGPHFIVHRTLANGETHYLMDTRLSSGIVIQSPPAHGGIHQVLIQDGTPRRVVGSSVDETFLTTFRTVPKTTFHDVPLLRKVRFGPNIPGWSFRSRMAYFCDDVGTSFLPNESDNEIYHMTCNYSFLPPNFHAPSRTDFIVIRNVYYETNPENAWTSDRSSAFFGVKYFASLLNGTAQAWRSTGNRAGGNKYVHPEATRNYLGAEVFTRCDLVFSLEAHSRVWGFAFNPPPPVPMSNYPQVTRSGLFFRADSADSAVRMQDMVDPVGHECQFVVDADDDDVAIAYVSVSAMPLRQINGENAGIVPVSFIYVGQGEDGMAIKDMSVVSFGGGNFIKYTGVYTESRTALPNALKMSCGKWFSGQWGQDDQMPPPSNQSRFPSHPVASQDVQMSEAFQKMPSYFHSILTPSTPLSPEFVQHVQSFNTGVMGTDLEKWVNGPWEIRKPYFEQRLWSDQSDVIAPMMNNPEFSMVSHSVSNFGTVTVIISCDIPSIHQGDFLFFHGGYSGTVISSRKWSYGPNTISFIDLGHGCRLTRRGFPVVYDLKPHVGSEITNPSILGLSTIRYDLPKSIPQFETLASYWWNLPSMPTLAEDGTPIIDHHVLKDVQRMMQPPVEFSDNGTVLLNHVHQEFVTTEADVTVTRPFFIRRFFPHPFLETAFPNANTVFMPPWLGESIPGGEGRVLSDISHSGDVWGRLRNRVGTHIFLRIDESMSGVPFRGIITSPEVRTFHISITNCTLSPPAQPPWHQSTSGGALIGNPGLFIRSFDAQNRGGDAEEEGGGVSIFHSSVSGSLNGGNRGPSIFHEVYDIADGKWLPSIPSGSSLNERGIKQSQGKYRTGLSAKVWSTLLPHTPQTGVDGSAQTDWWIKVPKLAYLPYNDLSSPASTYGNSRQETVIVVTKTNPSAGDQYFVDSNRFIVATVNNLFCRLDYDKITFGELPSFGSNGQTFYGDFVWSQRKYHRFRILPPVNSAWTQTIDNPVHGGGNGLTRSVFTVTGQVLGSTRPAGSVTVHLNASSFSGWNTSVGSVVVLSVDEGAVVLGRRAWWGMGTQMLYSAPAVEFNTSGLNVLVNKGVIIGAAGWGGSAGIDPKLWVNNNFTTHQDHMNIPAELTHVTTRAEQGGFAVANPAITTLLSINTSRSILSGGMAGGIATWNTRTNSGSAGHAGGGAFGFGGYHAHGNHQRFRMPVRITLTSGAVVHEREIPSRNVQQLSHIPVGFPLTLYPVRTFEFNASGSAAINNPQTLIQAGRNQFLFW